MKTTFVIFITVKNFVFLFFSEEIKYNSNASGAAAGAYGSTYGYLAGGGRSWRGALGAGVTGAIGGAFSPMYGFRSGGIAVAGGFTTGLAGSLGSRLGWW